MPQTEIRRLLAAVRAERNITPGISNAQSGDRATADCSSGRSIQEVGTAQSDSTATQESERCRASGDANQSYGRQQAVHSRDDRSDRIVDRVSNSDEMGHDHDDEDEDRDSVARMSIMSGASSIHSEPCEPSVHSPMHSCEAFKAALATCTESNETHDSVVGWPSKPSVDSVAARCSAMLAASDAASNSPENLEAARLAATTALPVLRRLSEDPSVSPSIQAKCKAAYMAARTRLLLWNASDSDLLSLQ